MYHHYQYCITTMGPQTPRKSEDEFTLFPFLPPELRLKIWEAVAAEPQTVELSCTPTSSYLSKGRWFSHNKPPVIFGICSESRSVALTHYSELEFSSDQIGVPWPKLYFNFELDTLWLCNDLCAFWAKDLLEKNLQVQQKLKFLAVDEKLWKSLNQPIFTPGANVTLSGLGIFDMNSKVVISYLGALENLRFHKSL